MTEFWKVTFAGMCGALATLLIVHGVVAAGTAMRPTRVLHYYGSEPLTAEEQAEADGAEARGKAARITKARDFAQRCLVDPKRNTVFISDSGAVACSWVGMPPEVMFEGK